MIKKLDQYIIKTFFGPFFFIFSVLFFIFIVNVVWILMYQIAGKGLTYWEIGKLLFYIGASVVNMVMPLTILLASIMTFGDFGERYELAAMKSAGISLLRIMRPLLFVSVALATILYFFSNNVIPDFQRKSKNMIYNIISTRPALNFTPGVFINTIPGMSVKFDEISGENGEKIKGVFIHKLANSYENTQTVVAERGKFVPAKDRNYLKLILYKGYMYEDKNENLSYQDRLKQPNQVLKFDSLVQHFDVSILINKAVEEEKITDDYKFQTFIELNKTVKDVKKQNVVNYQSISNELIAQQNSYLSIVDKVKIDKKLVKQPFDINKLKEDKKLQTLSNAYNKIEQLKTTKKNKDQQIADMKEYYSKVVMYQQRIIAYSITCIIFFMIGASLGSIIRKGGVGLPVVIAIVIFIIFYIINLSVENAAWKGKMNPYLAAWLPNLILFPFAAWMTSKALTDSQLFDSEKYKALIMPIINRFWKPKQKEHARYQ